MSTLPSNTSSETEDVTALWFEDPKVLFDTDFDPRNKSVKEMINVFTKLCLIVSLMLSYKTSNFDYFKRMALGIGTLCVIYTLIMFLCKDDSKDVSRFSDTEEKCDPNPVGNPLHGKQLDTDPKVINSQKMISSLKCNMPVDPSEQIYGGFENQFYPIPNDQNNFAQEVYGSLQENLCKEGSIFSHLGNPATAYHSISCQVPPRKYSP